jgi:hypothetical protein
VSAGPFADYLAHCSNTQALGTVTQANGGLYGDIVTGAGKVVDKNFDFTGIAADPRFKVDALLQTDTQGRPLFNDAHSTATNGGNRRHARRLPGVVQPRASPASTGARVTRCRPSPSTAPRPAAPSCCPRVATAPRSPTTRRGCDRADRDPGVGRHLRDRDRLRFGRRPLHDHLPGDQLQRAGGVGSVRRRPAAPDRRHRCHVEGHRRCSGVGGTDSLLRGIGGDWSQAAYGVGMDITVKKSDRGLYFDGTTWHSAFQENLTLLLVEAYFGFVMGDNDAFVAYTKGTATF